MKKLVVVVIILVGSVFLRAKTVQLNDDNVNSVFQFQHTPQWCWAATIEMALKYYHFQITQQEIVLRTFGNVVNMPGNWIQMTQNLNYLGTTNDGVSVLVSAVVYAGSPTAEVIINHLKQHKPIIMAFNNPNTFTGHAVFLTGVDYHFIGTKAIIDSIIIRDPYPYNQMHIYNGGKVTTPNIINPTNMWLIDATVENL